MVTVGNVNIVIYEKIVLVLHPHVDVRTVWYVRHLSLVWMTNFVYVIARMLHLYKFTISRRCRQTCKTSR